MCKFPKGEKKKTDSKGGFVTDKPCLAHDND